MAELAIGDERIVDIGTIAHGGHFIAHSDGRTLFVRHGISGERARVVITEVSKRIVRADVVEVLEPSLDRVVAPCPWAGVCGGCDFQHVAVPRQRELKSIVLREAMMRFGRIAAGDPVLDVHVEELPGAPEGLHWRTRMTWATAPDGTIGLRRHRSHEVVAVGECLLAEPDVSVSRLTEPHRLVREVRDRSWRISSADFWQVHAALPEALVDAVLEFGRPRPGEHWLDLYAGVGLFAAFLGQEVGATGAVEAVESDEGAVKNARRALHDMPTVRLHCADVPKWLAQRGSVHEQEVAGVVLDPPRAGAGESVVRAVARLRPRAVVYVACDPVTLARDVAVFADAGYRLAQLRSFDAFPMTHHFETVALLTG